MGSPLAPVIANFYMELFESRALDTAAQKPLCWYRYVDGTFAAWPHRADTLIAGRLKSTPMPWLHVTNNITSSELRRQDGRTKEWKKIVPHTIRDLPIHDVLDNIPSARLKPWKPTWDDPYLKQPGDYNILEEWRKIWRL
ncbi:hypothetical protein Trydic_g6104 [Trypoxylus dichotomus]